MILSHQKRLYDLKGQILIVGFNMMTEDFVPPVEGLYFKETVCYCWDLFSMIKNDFEVERLYFKGTDCCWVLFNMMTEDFVPQVEELYFKGIVCYCWTQHDYH
jgi:cytochrome c oxidase assembly protein Cox11